MIEEVDLLIFDWDGTLFDSIGWIVTCLRRSAAETGLPVPGIPEARSVIGLSLAASMAQLFPDQAPEAIERLVTRYRELYHDPEAPRLDLYEGARDQLEILSRSGYLLAVATGKARTGLDLAIVETGTHDLFAVTRCADETAPKPDPSMLYQILSELEVSAERALLIGDSVHDLKMASNAGVRSVGVATGASLREELLSLAPICCISDIRELSRILV